MKYPVRKRRYQYAQDVRCWGCRQRIKRHRLVRCAAPTKPHWQCTDRVRDLIALESPAVAQLPTWHKRCHQQFHAAAQLLLHGAPASGANEVQRFFDRALLKAALPTLVPSRVQRHVTKVNTMVFRRLNRGS